MIFPVFIYIYIGKGHLSASNISAIIIRGLNYNYIDTSLGLFSFLLRKVDILKQQDVHVDADRKLKRIMAKEAGKAVGVVISMGKFFKSPEADNFFKHIVTRVEHLMPDNTCHCLLVSYSWLLGATFKVKMRI